MAAEWVESCPGDQPSTSPPGHDPNWHIRFDWKQVLLFWLLNSYDKVELKCLNSGLFERLRNGPLKYIKQKL